MISSQTNGNCVFASPGFELVCDTRRTDGQVVKNLSHVYHQDIEKIDIFEAEIEFATVLGLSQFPDFLPLVTNIPGPCYATRVENGLSVQDLVRLSDKTGMHLPVSVSVALLQQLATTIDLHINSFPLIDPDLSHFPEYNPASVFIDQSGQLLFTHINSGLAPSLNATLFKNEDRPYLYCAAPEQCIDGRQPHASSALFVLGNLLFQLLTGRGVIDPWYRTPVDVLLTRKARQLHPLISDIRPELAGTANSLVMDLLHSLPERRRVDLDGLKRIINTMKKLPVYEEGPTIETYLKALKTAADEGISGAQHERELLARSTSITELNDS